MSTRRAFFLLVPFSLLAGCGSTTTPPERLPGLSYTAPASDAIIRENDHLFVQSIDGQGIESNFGISLGTHKTYRQFELPPGAHRLTLLYNQNGNPNSLSLGSGGGLNSIGTRSIAVTLLPHHTYTLLSNADKVYLILGSMTTAKWDPVLTDDADQKNPVK